MPPLSLEGEGWGEGDNLSLPHPIWVPASAGTTTLLLKPLSGWPDLYVQL